MADKQPWINRSIDPLSAANRTATLEPVHFWEGIMKKVLLTPALAIAIALLTVTQASAASGTFSGQNVIVHQTNTYANGSISSTTALCASVTVRASKPQGMDFGLYHGGYEYMSHVFWIVKANTNYTFKQCWAHGTSVPGYSSSQVFGGLPTGSYNNLTFYNLTSTAQITGTWSFVTKSTV
jgi:hypothetical protein